MSASRVCLPDEVLLLIGEHIDSRSDRYNLPLVCRQFHQLFLSLFYRNVQLHDWRQAYSFLKALIARPFLSAAIHELDSSQWQQDSVPIQEWQTLWGCPTLNRCITGLAPSKQESEMWMHHLLGGRGDTWTALLFPLLSHIRKLHLVYYECALPLRRVLYQAVTEGESFIPDITFSHLREVSLLYQGDTSFVGDISLEHPNLLLMFTQLPSACSIVADSVVEFQTSTEPHNVKGLTPYPMTLRFSSPLEIDLRRSCANQGMASLIPLCSNLRSFKYQHSDQHLASHGYQPARLRRWLSPSRATLQTLWLDHYGDHYAFTAGGLNQTRDEWFGSLAEFSALKEVRIRLPNLLDIQYQTEPTQPLVDCLPATLEHLHVEGCEERHVSMLVAQLRSVVQMRHKTFPCLHRLEIEGPFQQVSTEHESEDASHRPEEFAALQHTIKPKILQAVEPLHEDCVSSGIALHLLDRTVLPIALDDR
ncbi:hypothetical protein PDE_03315 [Penicillium oxalicum 114-2]|uniref:Uncharacterized protein n=1 Tax=Penicillium oxalicum (strain 114-2 / CGMCC 5302) TaxID=933388 RepID=S7ZDP0_PENO1|nr:hypothetical protein PDE_03315 [Penicillium oxalicum 114-2]